jgi:hypothetical protein
MTDKIDATALNTDELIAKMEHDEAEDAPLITPVNYAHIRPITAQLVYYAIRTGKLAVVICPCGRKCLDKGAADNYYRSVRGEVAWPWGKPDE